MAGFSIHQLCRVTGYSRDAIRARVHLYGEDPKKILHLAPLGSEKQKAGTLEAATIQERQESAALKRAQRQKIEGSLADVDELIRDETDIFEGISKIIKGADIPADSKADIFDAIKRHLARWGERR